MRRFVHKWYGEEDTWFKIRGGISGRGKLTEMDAWRWELEDESYVRGVVAFDICVWISCKGEAEGRE